MSIPLRQYHAVHGGHPFPLLALQRHTQQHGPPDAAAVAALSEELKLPAASIRAAATYYADLHADESRMRVCQGSSCMLAGAGALKRQLDEHHSCAAVYCLGFCDRSPAALRPDGRVVLHCDVRNAVDTAAGMAVPPPPSIRCAAPQPIVTRNLTADCSALAVARSRGVYRAARTAVAMTPQAIVDLIERSGERGRGGAGFPTGRKWRQAADAPGSRKFVIANGDEGDPGSFIDRVLMEQDPHSILEGMIISAVAIGAHEGVLFIRSEYPRAISQMQQAIAAARDAGILGPNVLGSGFAFDVAVFPAMGSYVCGEETAMLNAIEGFRGEVRVRPPYPAHQGLYGMPTLVNNVETLANVGWIISSGPDAYRALGTTNSPGTKAMCLNHGFALPGIVEVEMGISLRDVIEREGGGGRDAQPIEAVLLGGPMGSVLFPHEWDVPVCYDAMEQRSIRLGHGGLIAVHAGTDWQEMLRHWLQFMQHESCGKCVPCRVGSQRALELVGQDVQSLQLLRQLLDVISAGSLCAFGQLVPLPVRTVLDRIEQGGRS